MFDTAQYFTDKDDPPMTEINTTPLIDVMLVLLIMLIVTLPVMTHAVKLDFPGVGLGEQRETVVIEIDYDDSLYWDGAYIRDLLQLQDRLRSTAGLFPQPEVHVKANRRARYDTVAKVLASAQRNGIRRLGLVGNEQFVDEGKAP